MNNNNTWKKDSNPQLLLVDDDISSMSFISGKNILHRSAG